MSEWHDTMMASMPLKEKGDPLWTVVRETGPFHATIEDLVRTGYLERLKSTGREQGLKALLERHPGAAELLP